jgi:integrase
MWRSGRLYYRQRVPTSLLSIVGKREIWRSLGTDSLTVALRRSHEIAASIERYFEAARSQAGLPVDHKILSMADEKLAIRAEASSTEAVVSLTLREVYDTYMTDPTRDWSPRTRMAYETTRRQALSLLGGDTPIRSITRAHCREMIELLRWLPRNSSKIYPKLSPVEIAAKSRKMGRTDLISPANINTYLNKLCGVFNWAMKEQFIDRNPAVGLKVPDPILRREKRLPFAMTQLQAIFAAPLYVGCQDDGHGYARPGDQRPKTARFWIPLIGLFCGLRLNEICQLDVADIKVVEDVPCFWVTASTEADETDKRLKTSSSERLVPIHPYLLELSFMTFVGDRRASRNTKLFGEIEVGCLGYRSSTFSQWFRRFVKKAGADSPKTCFHSLRHNFRDAMREARLDRDIALALGGWSRAGGSGGSASVSDAYGSGYRVGTLLEAIGQVAYPDIDLSHLGRP